MKKGKLFSTFALTFLAIGVGASLIGTHDVVRADAAENEPTPAETATLFVDFRGGPTWWGNDNAKLYAYCFESTSSNFAWSSEIVGTGINNVWKFDLPALTGTAKAWDKLTINRMNPANSDKPGYPANGASWNKTVDTAVPTGEFNCIKVLDQKDSKENYKTELSTFKQDTDGLMSGTKVYFNAQQTEPKVGDNCENFAEAKANIYFYSYNEEGADLGSLFTKFVPATGKYAGLAGIYETTLPKLNDKDVKWLKGIVVRMNPANQDNENYPAWGDKWNQTTDIDLNDTDSYITMSKPENGKYTAALSTTETLDNIVAFATKFLELTSVCDSTGATNKVAAIWADVVKEYNKLTDAEKRIVKHSAAIGNGELGKALARYDLIISKYDDMDDFMGRRAPKQGTPLSITENFTTLIIIATVVAAAAITAISVIAIRKKRLAK